MTSTYEVMAFILSLVNFRQIFNNSVASSGFFCCISKNLSLLRSQATLSCSAATVPVRSVSEKKGSSPQVVPGRMSSWN